MRVVLTGAAGFIGSAVWAALRSHGHEVVPVDAMIPHAHAAAAEAPAGVHRVDVRDGDAMRELLRDADAVCHQAAMVGAGVDAADLPLFAAHNDLGTAVLLAVMAEQRVRRLVLASSMVVYGEGRYECAEHGDVVPEPRTLAALRSGDFEPHCPRCGNDVEWALVDEDTPLRPRSSYAAGKAAQEHYALAWTRQTDSAAIALRYHNVYGPWMPQDSPYSGVGALFRSRLERGEPPRVFEDGAQMRDFVHVDDVAAANVRALEGLAAEKPAAFAAYNVCSGTPLSIWQMARLLGTASNGPEPVVTGEFRPGDVRHVVASPDRAISELGFRAAIDPEDGLRAFATAPLR